MIVAVSQPDRNKGDIEEMIGKYFQIRNGNFDNPQVNKDQADDSADETTWKEESLKKGNPGSQKHAHNQHACQPAENQHGFKRKRGCHFYPLVLLLLGSVSPLSIIMLRNTELRHKRVYGCRKKRLNTKAFF